MTEYAIFLNGYLVVEADTEEEAITKVHKNKSAIDWEVSEVERNE